MTTTFLDICDNFVLQRKFIRETGPNNDRLHEQFRTWLHENHTLTDNLDQIVAEDQLIDYEAMFAQLNQAENTDYS